MEPIDWYKELGIPHPIRPPPLSVWEIDREFSPWLVDENCNWRSPDDPIYQRGIAIQRERNERSLIPKNQDPKIQEEKEIDTVCG